MEEWSGRQADCVPMLFKWYIRLACMRNQILVLRYSLTHASTIQKGVMISHRNVISNVLQIATFEKPYRDSKREPGSKYTFTEIALGLLPQSHIYSLVVICHATTWRGDQVINLPKFEIAQFLTAIQTFRINTLFLVSQLQRYPHNLLSGASIGAANHYRHGEE